MFADLGGGGPSKSTIVTRMGSGGDQGCMIEGFCQVPTASSLELLGVSDGSDAFST